MDAETEYYVRMILLIFKGGMLIFKSILKRELTKANVPLQEILEPHRSKLKHKLLKAQYLLLFPRSGDADPEDFDLSLLIVVLLDVLNVTEVEREEIKKIKEMRNKITHGGKVSLDKVSYTSMKASLQDILSKLSAGLQVEIQQECSEMIDKFLAEPLDETTALHYVHAIRNDEEILQRVHDMLEEHTWTIVNEIKESESRMETKLEDLKDILDKMNLSMKESDEEKEKGDDAGKCEIAHRPLCEKCFENYISSVAIVYCHTCCLYLCEDCYQTTHVKSLLLSMKNHHLQNATDAAESGVDMKDMDICNLHNVHLTCYCKEHEQLCCEKCLHEEHQNCTKVVELNEIAEKSVNYVLDPVATINNLQCDITSMQKWVVAEEEKLNKQSENLAPVIEELKKEMIELFDKKASIFKAETEILQREKMSHLQKNRSQCEELINNAEQRKRSLIRIASTGTAAQKFIAHCRLNIQIKSFQDDFARVKDMYEHSTDLGDFYIFEEIAQNLGPLSFKVPNVDQN